MVAASREARGAGEGSNLRGESRKLIGAWLTEDVLVRANEKDVRAFDSDTGKARWTVKPPAPGLVPCAMSGTPGDGGKLGAIVYGTGPKPTEGCDQLVVLDLANGRTTWSRSLTVRKPPGPEAVTRIGVAGGTLVVLSPADEAGYRLSDGGRLWKRRWYDSGCVLAGARVGQATVVEVARCGPGEGRLRIREVDARDGSVRWATQLPTDVIVTGIATAKPASVTLRATRSRRSG
ncbi:PQQ-binding-like beta-propeller repeat protein [Streptomyces sp. NPDC006365]|uniref:outer membrane protein assembly factor BamB family protein n=1 Tax=Streptomyces sp. NPDC006365 TaxID=3364744 RepID=UPI00369C2854